MLCIDYMQTTIIIFYILNEHNHISGISKLQLLFFIWWISVLIFVLICHICECGVHSGLLQ